MAMDKKMKQISTTPYLHEELIFSILTWLPAKVLNNSMKYVCKGWANMIRDPHFIEAHLLRANTGLLIDNIDSPSHARFLETKDGMFRVTDLNHWFLGIMVASCEGVSLFKAPNDHRALFVANPVFMQVVTLPYLNLPPNCLHISSSIARISSTGEYKVVVSYEDPHRVFRWLVLTVGIDNSWREIDSQPTYHNRQIYFCGFPLSVRGVFYLTNCDFQLDGIYYFLAMDMGDETIHKIPIPSRFAEPCAYVKMGNYLTGFTVKKPNLQFEVQVLKDFRRGEWTKVYEIDIEIRGYTPRDLFCLVPIGWMNNDQVLFLEALTCRGYLHLAYNAKTRQTSILHIAIGGHDFAQVHTDSLVSWKKM